MENQEHPFVFEDGDVRAKAKHDERIITFKLSSHALCFASPVWKKFVFPPFPLLSSLGNEEEPNSKKARAVPEEPFPDIELDFTEDNPEALLILLQIAHLKFSKIPSQLPYEVLYNVAVICDQYDCRSLVKPWIQGWLKDEANEAYLPHREGWLWIAYYFGRKEELYHMMKMLALRLSVGKDGGCMLLDPSLYRENRTLKTKRYPLGLERSPLPLEITDAIIRLRKDMIYNLMLRFTANIMKCLLDPNMDSPCKELCPLAMYGLMSKCLSERNLWPLPRKESYDSTPFQLYKTVVRALNLSFVAHKPVANLCIGRCRFTDQFKQRLLIRFKNEIRNCDVHWNEGGTDGERFQKFMDHAVKEVGNFDCPSEALPGGALDIHSKEILELCPMKSSK
ncbi:uncharacterized protein EAE98_004120 [Botrytis deweyae]|uniref:BTB domain-containing protein n=1 Tax=Botrytis deweyae TaxID=2478750 RepID=A0ABQ7ISM3_9HELO|nr:uncharacterized protein EAE98_004120 [Botrytis deweyae]KAF7932821.1 hypothetical protein EAE98_004120 [Botrytis deweyae]